MRAKINIFRIAILLLLLLLLLLLTVTINGKVVHAMEAYGEVEV
jgi:hypothetical protein